MFFESREPAELAAAHRRLGLLAGPFFGGLSLFRKVMSLQVWGYAARNGRRLAGRLRTRFDHACGANGSLRRARWSSGSGCTGSTGNATASFSSFSSSASSATDFAATSMEPEVPSEAQVVIIGGGIIGNSVAYHLAKEGVQDVLLLEQDRLTSGTTWHAAGLMVTFGSLSETATEIRKYSKQLYRDLEVRS